MITQKTIVLVNGPPRSGKDTVANLLANHGYQPLKFAGSLKAGLAGLLGLSIEEYLEYFETDAKAENGGPFEDLTPRQALIDLSEEYMKPRFGQDIFGKVAANVAFEVEGDVVFSDCGFDAEVIPVVHFFGAENCRVIRLAREGCNWDGDSRTYLNPYLFKGVKFDWVRNNGTVADLEEVALGVLQL